MSEFRFAQPQYAHALWAVLAFVALLVWFERRGSGALDRLVGPALQARLVRRAVPWRRWARIALLGLAAACLVAALMRPQLGVRYVAAQRVGSEIMIALDVSKSMLAEDVAPNRLERAKAEIVDLLSYLEGDQVGLIAFAGRASVLAPLTPDFSFLRLVLDGVGPHSVSRGGTRLEEPIRKAVAGFGESGDAARAILLITDGEDHDSFPLDAAQAAADAGIVIIAIGFGDENGSTIYYTDPDTGARQLLRDGNGAPVRSRLDGDLLRDIALATGGAYVPAGTGVLDLESIYRQHIAGLTAGQLDPRGRAVRDEAYQWAVLAALVLLVAAVAVSSASVAVAAALVCAVTLSGGPPASAGQSVSPGSAAATAVADAAGPASGAAPGGPAPAADDGPGETESPEPEPTTPREVYNRGVAALEADDYEEAIRRFESARREAAGDAELRFRSAYQLGLATARAAGALEEGAPRDALGRLYTAADWFRDAIAQRPEHADARANLEVALRRALLLADRLAGKPEGLAAELKELAGRQREVVGDLAGLLQLIAADPERFAEDRLRREFRARATSQRALLADGDRMAREIDTERESLAAKSDDERTPDDRMRAAQLEAVLHYLHRAREKMGQTRRQLRQRQGERAYRRGADALAELKRAIDQLSDPVELIDVLIREASEVAVGTAQLEAAQRAPLSGPAPPVWLTAPALRDDQQQVAERVAELDERLRAGLDAEPGPDPRMQALVESVAEAEPFVADAAGRSKDAANALEADEPSGALDYQRDAVRALGEARERFLDVRGLIEATYADEQRIAAVLSEQHSAAERAEFVNALHDLQKHNIARAERLAGKLEAEAAAPPPAPEAGGEPPDAEAEAIRQKRYELASQLLTLTLGQMDDVRDALAGRPAAWPAAKDAGGQAVANLERLRRLFLSIAEQIRDALRQQVELADATQDAAALAHATGGAPASDAPAAAKLAERQSALGGRAGELAAALETQSNETGGVLEEEAEGYETSVHLRAAGEHVLLAQQEMEGAADGLGAEPPELEPAHGRQQQAARELELALAELVPPEDREKPEDGDSQQQQQQQEPSQPQPGESEQQQAGEPQRPDVDPAQMLQEVRDREAQRRREREGRGSAKYETVEKDW